VRVIGAFLGPHSDGRLRRDHKVGVGGAAGHSETQIGERHVAPAAIDQCRQAGITRGSGATGRAVGWERIPAPMRSTKTMKSNAYTSGLFVYLALLSTAAAQTSQPVPQVAPPVPQVAGPNTPVLPEQIRPPDQGDQSLSDKLSRQQGTLKPPVVDPGIHAPLPTDTKGAMRVIPPSGSPGGNQAVPK
jgi:hypothetical protein